MMFKKIFLVIILLGLISQTSLMPILRAEKEAVSAIEFKNLRDPFVSLLPKKEKKEIEPVSQAVKQEEIKLPDFSLQGLIWGSDRPQAIIDNRVYNIGDEIKEAKIIKISKEGIKLNYQGKIFLKAPQTTKPTQKDPQTSLSR